MIDHPEQSLCELTAEEMELISGGQFASFTVHASGAGNSSAFGGGQLATNAFTHQAAASAHATGFAQNNGAVAVFTSTFASA